MLRIVKLARLPAADRRLLEPLAHAWVEAAEGIVIGNMPDLSRYAPLHPREKAER